MYILFLKADVYILESALERWEQMRCFFKPPSPYHVPFVFTQDMRYFRRKASNQGGAGLRLVLFQRLGVCCSIFLKLLTHLRNSRPYFALLTVLFVLKLTEGLLTFSSQTAMTVTPPTQPHLPHQAAVKAPKSGINSCLLPTNSTFFVNLLSFLLIIETRVKCQAHTSSFE